MGKTTLNRRILEELIQLGVPQIFGGDNSGDGSSGGDPGDGDGDDPDEEDDDLDEEDDNDDPDDDAGNSGKTGKKAKTLAEKLEGVTDEKTRRIIEVSDESRKRKNKIKELLAENQALLEEKAKKDRKGNTETENLKRDVEDRDGKIDKMTKVLTNNLLETAILKFPDITFHDVELVVKAIDRDEIDVDLEEGKVEGLISELRRVAKDKPFLVASTKKNSKSKNNNGGGDGEAGSGSSGSNPGGAGGRNNDGASQRKKLIEQYPVLDQH